MTQNRKLTLSVVVPCYNEQEVLNETTRQLLDVISHMADEGLVSENSKVYFVDDGSTDDTWPLICDLSRNFAHIGGIKLSCNRGHQNALLAGLLSVPGDILISVDADLQDDVAAIPKMVKCHLSGKAEIVFGVRGSRDTDSYFKRMTAECYYQLLKKLGSDVVFNHADYRLMSRIAIEALRQYQEVNLFLRGIIPQIGFKTDIVTYDRKERFAGESKYPVRKMLALAIEGITSLSTHPLRWITIAGFIVSALSLIFSVVVVCIRLFSNSYVIGWASIVAPLLFLSGIQLLSLGIVGEYLGKVYLETKRRPRYIIERTENAELLPTNPD